MQEDKFERLNLFFKNKEVKYFCEFLNRKILIIFFNKSFYQIDPEDVQARQEYLRSQRDKILKIKKKVRAKQLNDTTKQNGRPSSAQAAQKILDGNNVKDIAQDSIKNSASELRKALATRLKAEVINQQE